MELLNKEEINEEMSLELNKKKTNEVPGIELNKEEIDEVPSVELNKEEIDEVPSVELNKTVCHTLTNYSFGNVPIETLNKIYKDGRPFSHLIEGWAVNNYPLVYVNGCKDHDFIDKRFENIKYEAKTFTQKGCIYMPSNMIGTGRKVKLDVLKEKAQKLIYCIVSNINFPEIKIKFVKGTYLLENYPKGRIPSSKYVNFFD